MINKKTQSAKIQAGFTMIELMTVLIISGLLMGYGLPAYNDFSQRKNISNQANDLLGDLNFARVLAVDKGTIVSVVSTNNGDWEGGWTIIQDLPTDPVTKQTVRIKQAIAGSGITITELNNIDTITYDSLGATSQSISFNFQSSSFANFLILNVLPSGLATTIRTDNG